MLPVRGFTGGTGEVCLNNKLFAKVASLLLSHRSFYVASPISSNKSVLSNYY